MDYAYQSEKLSTAPRCLMLPHTKSVEHSIAQSFHECSLAFHHLDKSKLDDDARSWLSKINKLMDTTGNTDNSGEGTWVVKARSLTLAEQMDLSHAVDELAHWFKRKFWS